MSYVPTHLKYYFSRVCQFIISDGLADAEEFDDFDDKLKTTSLLEKW